jgi:hypothetical protein
MRPLFATVLCLFVGMWVAGSAYAQKPGEVNQATNLVTPQSQQLQGMARELSLARRAGDVARVKELQSLMYDVLPATPEEPAGPGLAPQPGGWSEVAAAPFWGGDAKIHTGYIRYGARREIALDADTLGNIFCAVNAIYPGTSYSDTGSAIRVYRSTNGGESWSQVQGFIYSLDIVQSIDMCVTDTLAGKWLISVVWVAQSRVADKGGNLYWGSFLNDGSSWRYTLIAQATAGTAYRNPSICTDGKYYSPSVTYHYVAAEYITPATGDSRGLYINTSQTWGKTWTQPDTSIRGFKEGTPTIAVDWGSSPDSLLVSFTRTFSATDTDPRIGRNSLSYSGNWALTYPTSSSDNEYDPSFAVDPLTGDGMLSYTKNRGNSGNLDVFYAYSTDRFTTFKIDSIATSPSATEELSAVSQAPYSSPTQSAWRVVYRTSSPTSQIAYKWQSNKLNALGVVGPQQVSQFAPSGVIVPALSAIKWTTGALYVGICAYAGLGPNNIWFDGSNISLQGVDRDDGPVPGSYALEQNYPNPFNPETFIGFRVAQAGPVKLQVFDLLGREVAVLVNEQKDPGGYRVRFDGSGLPSGVYLYRLTAGNFVDAKKLVLVR